MLRNGMLSRPLRTALRRRFSSVADGGSTLEGYKILGVVAGLVSLGVGLNGFILAPHFSGIEKKLEAHDTRFSTLDERFKNFDTSLSLLEDKVDMRLMKMEDKMMKMEERMIKIESKIDNLTRVMVKSLKNP